MAYAECFQTPELSVVNQEGKFDGPHTCSMRVVVSSNFESPSTQRLVLAAQAACQVWDWPLDCRSWHKLAGGKRTQSHWLERWQRKHLYI